MHSAERDICDLLQWKSVGGVGEKNECGNKWRKKKWRKKKWRKKGIMLLHFTETAWVVKLHTATWISIKFIERRWLL